ncbi:phosphotransferase system enzyme I (PtsI) [Entomoplasma freundtii]|uniref:Phosphoenolpyruvate-protein phosphotransferase n=1 Tax=Entomoplasma freundtii TaxID=74700 RepID=A0A2K8NR03_9MOLU|nr:phosphoenolpyruvate--protein phosphotransferase [Entomoplasma freundtii]ATZ16217.1 phosphoenolpyruvate-protein phosphotransferase [Entomoplasma freundtii]TDY56882.1 phosphotransferase system enzyme I (PtsI) [Entomoplasma freundtii]
MSKKIIGIGASEGLALAKALVLAETELKITKEKITDEKTELAKVDQAVTDSLLELEKLRLTTQQKLGDEKAAIFEAHKDIANDPEMQNEIKDLIKTEKVNAAYAIHKVTNNYYEMFSQMDDPYFKERSADIKDIANRLIKHVLGLPIIDLSTINEEVIIVADDLTPSQTAQLDKNFVKGFATNIGGRTSHAAIMARSLEIPAVLGLKVVTEKVKNHALIALDGDQGFVEVDLSENEINTFKEAMEASKVTKAELNKFKNRPTETADGTKKLIEGNIGSPNDAEAVIERGGDGVGLFRTEFLYMDNDHFPTEEEQFVAYKKVAQTMEGKVVVIRTLDIGGDKKLSYYEFPHEMNPFLGYRAIRFTLAEKGIFRDQIRALLRASAFGKIAIMFPMIATVDEFKAAKEFVELCKKELDNEKIAYDKKIEIGMMIEIPAAAVLADKFAEHADFFSIGTNDLVQYSMAADRMSQNVAYLYQPTNPSILRLIKMTIDGGHKHNRWVGMCGEMAGEPQAIPLLLGLGLDAFSMSASSILKARSLMSKINLAQAEKLANQALECETEAEVLKLVDNFIAKLK